MDKKTVCPAITKSNRKRVNKRRLSPDSKPDVSFTTTTKFTCSQCYARSCCRGLCPPMEWLVSRVEIEPGKEDNLKISDLQKNREWPESLTTPEIIFSMFFFDKMTQEKIAESLYVSQQYVSKIIKKYKLITIKNLRK